jgi:UDP-glucose 4-epimerase
MRSDHGIIYDLIIKLRRNQNRLEILGNGEQEKSYIHISDCLNALFFGLGGKDIVNIYNVGSEDVIKVKKIAQCVCDGMNLKPFFEFTGGKVGWMGDVPNMQLDIKKLKSMGWSPKMNSEEAVKRTINEMVSIYEK